MDFREAKVREERNTLIWEALGCGNRGKKLRERTAD